MFRFPWGDMHSLNLGWFLEKFKELREDWATAQTDIANALDAEIQRAEDALSDVFDARDAAAASATAAAGSATAAGNSATLANNKATAAGTSATAAQNSATAAASSATLANNKATAAGLSEAAAAQSATTASTKATNAAASATAAGNSATAAANSATAAGNSATTAGNSATAAGADKLVSEGFAVGEQNGTPVGPDSPYYHNNAKYYSEQGGGGGGGAGVAFLTPELALTRMGVHDGTFTSNKKVTKIEQNTVTITPITTGTDSEVFCISNPTPRKTGSSLGAYTPQLADLVPFTTPFNIEYFIAKAVGMTGACGIRIIPCTVDPDTQAITKGTTLGANPTTIGFNSVPLSWGDTSGITHYAVMVQQASSFELEYTFMFAKPTTSQLGNQSLSLGDETLPYNPPAETM